MMKLIKTERKITDNGLEMTINHCMTQLPDEMLYMMFSKPIVDIIKGKMPKDFELIFKFKSMTCKELASLEIEEITL